MKKLLLATLALAVIAFAPSESTTTTNGKEIHLHNHAEAASVTWQCRKCGERIYGGNTPPTESGTGWCGGKFGNHHVWERLN